MQSTQYEEFFERFSDVYQKSEMEKLEMGFPGLAQTDIEALVSPTPGLCGWDMEE